LSLLGASILGFCLSLYIENENDSTYPLSLWELDIETNIPLRMCYIYLVPTSFPNSSFLPFRLVNPLLCMLEPYFQWRKWSHFHCLRELELTFLFRLRRGSPCLRFHWRCHLRAFPSYLGGFSKRIIWIFPILFEYLCYPDIALRPTPLFRMELVLPLNHLLSLEG